MMMKKAERTAISPELLFLKYKGVLAPWEILEQHKRFGFKCKKYANWTEVHVSNESRMVLKKVGDSLIDNSEFDLENYGEVSLVWERVQRWTKDKEGLSLEPEVLPGFEKISRLIEVGSQHPEVVDLFIQENGFDIELLKTNDRWLFFLALNIHDLLHSSKRYKNITDPTSNGALEETSGDSGVPNKKQNKVLKHIKTLYKSIGYELTANDPSSLKLLIRELGLVDEPLNEKRSSEPKLAELPRVWVEDYEGTPTDLIKFHHSEGNIYIKINKLHRVFNSTSELSKLLSNRQYWTLIGTSMLSHSGQIDDLQDFFNTFSRHLRGHVR